MDHATRTEPDAGTRPVGVVLAGGASKRMGQDKTKFLWPPEPANSTEDADDESDSGPRQPLWRHALERLREVTPHVVVADAGRCLAPPAEAPSVPDGPGQGPVAGLLGAAAAHPERTLLVLAADLPLVPPELLRHLAHQAADWALPRRGRGLEPLCALYRPAALHALKRRAESGVFNLHGLADDTSLRHCFVDDAELRRFGDPERLFWNVNRPSDWRRLVEMYVGSS